MGKEGGKGQAAPKKRFYVASISFGKDSSYMLCHILEHPEKYPLDMVIFVNTGFEFDAVYAVRDKLTEMLGMAGIPYKEINLENKFRYFMFSKEICKQGTNHVHRIGYGWCGAVCRWGTSLKLQALNDFYRKELSEYEVVEYVGIAADEADRMDIAARDSGRKVYPLILDDIKEADCLMNCYKRGFFWKEGDVYLYEILDRLSCWCCRNKNLKELKEMYYLLPKYWGRLRKIQERIPEPMKGEGMGVMELEKRFQKEGRQQNVYDMFSYLEMRR